MRTPSLREQAEEKRKLAAHLRLVGRTLSIPADRELMARHADDLQADADMLEAQANGGGKNGGAPDPQA
jgi:hypothetical protein